MKAIKAIVFAIILMVATPCATFAASTAATVAELVEGCKKTTKTYEYKGEKYVVYIGPRGGKFICVKITRGANKGKYRKQYLPQMMYEKYSPKNK